MHKNLFDISFEDSLAKIIYLIYSLSVFSHWQKIIKIVCRKTKRAYHARTNTHLQV